MNVFLCFGPLPSNIPVANKNDIETDTVRSCAGNAVWAFTWWLVLALDLQGQLTLPLLGRHGPQNHNETQVLLYYVFLLCFVFYKQNYLVFIFPLIKLHACVLGVCVCVC